MVQQKRIRTVVERWKAIEGHPSYEVSDHGRLRSISQWIENRNGVRRFWHGRILKTWESEEDDYRSHTLNGKGYFIHILVARAFVPNPDNKRFVNHKDGVKSNNYWKNLIWCTRSENMVHAIENGLVNGIIGSNHHLARLNEDKVREIYQMCLEGIGVTAIANKFKVEAALISFIRTGQTWRHVTGLPKPQPKCKPASG